MLNSQLWRAAQLKILPVRVMMSRSVLWVSAKFLPVTMMAASLTKSKRRLPSFKSAMEGKSELYNRYRMPE